MSSASWIQDQKRVERELQGQAYESLLERLRCQHPFYQQFRSWGDVIALVRSKSKSGPVEDDILIPIFLAFRGDRDPKWQTVLLAILWTELVRIHRFRGSWDFDREALWTNVTWAFLQSINALDSRLRSERLGQKVFNDTIHRLRDMYHREWDWENSIVVPGDWENEGEDDDEGEAQDRLENLMGGRRAVEFADVEARHDQEVEIRRLRGFVSRGLISETGFLVIVGTRIYGTSLSEFASDEGLNYEWAKKTRQRAEARIRRLGWKQKKP